MTVTLRASDGIVTLTLSDDGKGIGDHDPAQLEREGHMGLAGMRERITSLGGSVELRNGSPGATLRVKVPHA